MMIYKKILVLLFTVATFGAKAQDTAAMIKEFNKVMSFAVQPYVYYTSYTKLEANPVLQPEDTMNTKGEFYKYGNNLYYSNKQEEMFLEDSLFIQVNHDQKTIWVSKVDVETKDKMNILPLGDKKIQELFRKEFTISKTEVDEKSSRLNFEAKQYFDSISLVMVNIGLQYSGKKFMPELLDMNVNMKQLITDEQIEELKNQGADIKQAIQTVGGNNYFIRSQRVTVTFENVDNSKEKAQQIPQWQDKLNYNPANNEFSGKGIYSDYEITKTF
jgi:hypothetical protein